VDGRQPRPYLGGKTTVADLYAVLGVPRNADAEAIKRAYRRLAARYHPDRSPGAESERRFKEVTRAFEVLGDAKRRKLYDEFGDVALESGFDEERARVVRDFTQGFGGRGRRRGGGIGVEDLLGGLGGGASPFADLFGDLLQGARGRSGRADERDSDTAASVTIDFADAVRGTTVRLASADGLGDAVTVRIPAGADDGARLRVRGKGARGRGGARGDLLLTIHVRPHRCFTRAGDDLHLDLPVTIGEAYGGALVPVPTPGGEVKLKVPKGTQSGQRARLRGKGIARKGKPPGDLYVRFLVVYPEADDAEAARALETLARKGGDPRGGIQL
jgi:curved DNA-binding protein